MNLTKMSQKTLFRSLAVVFEAHQEGVKNLYRNINSATESISGAVGFIHENKGFSFYGTPNRNCEFKGPQVLL